MPSVVTAGLPPSLGAPTSLSERDGRQSTLPSHPKPRPATRDRGNRLPSHPCPLLSRAVTGLTTGTDTRGLHGRGHRILPGHTACSHTCSSATPIHSLLGRQTPRCVAASHHVTAPQAPRSVPRLPCETRSFKSWVSRRSLPQVTSPGTGL